MDAAYIRSSAYAALPVRTLPVRGYLRAYDALLLYYRPPSPPCVGLARLLATAKCYHAATARDMLLIGIYSAAAPVYYYHYMYILERGKTSCLRDECARRYYNYRRAAYTAFRAATPWHRQRRARSSGAPSGTIALVAPAIARAWCAERNYRGALPGLPARVALACSRPHCQYHTSAWSLGGAIPSRPSQKMAWASAAYRPTPGSECTPSPSPPPPPSPLLLVWLSLRRRR